MTSAPLRVTILDPLPERAEWAGLPDGGSYYSTPAWLRCSSRMTGGPVGAVEVRDGDRVVVVAPYWITTGRENPWRTPTKVLAPVDLPGERFLIAGTSTGYVSEMPAVDAGYRRRAVPLIVDALHDRAVAHGVDGCLALYARTELVEEYRRVLPGRTPVLLDAEAVQPVPATFDAYPAGVSAARRRRVRAEWRRFQQAGYTLDVERLTDCRDEFVPLYQQLERRHGTDLDADELHRVLTEMARTCGDADRVFTARRAGRLVAACLCYVDGRQLTARMFAVDYSATMEAFEYFGVTYYLPMRYAIEHGYRWLSLGTGTFGPKLARGAVLHPLWAVDLNPTPLWAGDAASAENLRRLDDYAVHPAQWADPPRW
ncbi:GNAT family N-acetyltransferase [Micromonospora echinofusca]|uniref:GNAT family N-acetyltransferase n=1 Tax=Micromonospora echinofusca TaxID=47858 RepID=A0ABS3W0G4_MICEH|nr:GNAT family N-acetyltransferase [Micromonospora echinofusca]MBO4210275.1 GNAT family N-acetyltransferase [Micromonospora echinofusca]